MKTFISLISIILLSSCVNDTKEVKTIQDLPDNVYESLVLSFPDANDEEIVELYTIYSHQLDSLQDDEVIIIK